MNPCSTAGMPNTVRMIVHSMRHFFGKGIQFSGSKLARKRQLENVVCNCL